MGIFNKIRNIKGFTLIELLIIIVIIIVLAAIAIPHYLNMTQVGRRKQELCLISKT